MQRTFTIPHYIRLFDWLALIARCTRPSSASPLSKIDCALSSALNSARKIFRQFFIFASPSLAALCSVYTHTTHVHPHISSNHAHRENECEPTAKLNHIALSHCVVVDLCEAVAFNAIFYTGSVCASQ